MYELSESIKKLRKMAFEWDIYQRGYIGQRLYWALRGLVDCSRSLPWIKIKSHMLSSIISGAEPIIHEDELLVGYNYFGDDGGMWSEVILHPRKGGEKAELETYLQKGKLSESQIEFVLSALDKIPDYMPHMRYTLESPREAVEATREGILWAMGTPENHTVLDYKKVLAFGFEGISKEIEKSLSQLSWNDTGAVNKKLVLQSAHIIAGAASNIGFRYRQKALETLQSCDNDKRRYELSRIVEVLDTVPAKPARTFHEALQSLWFTHIINTWEDGINANSLGRLDQILYPYYKRDLEENRITREEAFELLCCLWIKLYRDYDVQQVTLGGVDSEGNDAANELTYMMLDVTEALEFIRCLSVRLHSGVPLELVKRSMEVVGKGKGIPFFFNDDAIIPALVDSGIDIRDARDYAPIGCVEITIPGKANPHAVSNRLNLLKCLELALNNGYSITTGWPGGIKTGDPSQMKSIEEVFNAYEKQVEHFAAIACFESNRCELENSLTFPLPFKSMLTEGCLESGRDFSSGGAKYNYHESMAMGIPNVADSLAAIQKLVFEDKKYTLKELMGHIKNNFPDESIRQEFLKKAPKYGNDDNLVDIYAERVMTHFCTTVKNMKGLWGLGFFAQPFTFLWHVEAGEKTSATPDGRRNGENLAYSLSPMQGCDFNGLTAVFNSLAKLPNKMAAGSTSAIVEAAPELFDGENITYLALLLKTAIRKGIGQVQFNVVNEETLKKAQLEPDKYRNLAVRVSGFSQKFCLLDKKLQDHIIARTKHKRL